MRRFFILLLCFFIYCVSFVNAQTKDEFQQRREYFMKQMARNSVAIFKNAPVVQGKGGYRSDSNFYYLTGWTEPNAFLFLFKRRAYIQQIGDFAKELFLIPRARNARAAQFDGAQKIQEDVMNKMGFGVVASSDLYDALLNYSFARFDSIYINIQRVGLNEPLSRELDLIRQARERLSDFEILSPIPFLAEMRTIKSSAELEKLE